MDRRNFHSGIIRPFQRPEYEWTMAQWLNIHTADVGVSGLIMNARNQPTALRVVSAWK